MNLEFRQACENDLGELIDLLADDVLGAAREVVSHPIKQSYKDAFQSINTDPNNELIVAASGDDVIGMMQLTFIPYLTHTGSRRCLIEGVRISSLHRGERIGEQMLQFAISRAKTRNCKIVQLTSDKKRPDALRFYERLGFKPTHEGFKLALG
ncbi:MAG: GNAT family N-acetyltransferase [Pseudomonadota bacterium]